MTNIDLPLKIVKIVNISQRRGITAEKVECQCEIAYMAMA
jgi:hypothetical protein